MGATPFIESEKDFVNSLIASKVLDYASLD